MSCAGATPGEVAAAAALSIGSAVVLMISPAALSRDRLRVCYGNGGGEVFISPADREGFLRELRAARDRTLTA